MYMHGNEQLFAQLCGTARGGLDADPHDRPCAAAYNPWLWTPAAGRSATHKQLWPPRGSGTSWITREAALPELLSLETCGKVAVFTCFH